MARQLAEASVQASESGGAPGPANTTNTAHTTRLAAGGQAASLDDALHVGLHMLHDVHCSHPQQLRLQGGGGGIATGGPA